MLYEVRMTTTYSYGRSAIGGRHLLRLMPGEISGSQRLIAGALEITPRPQDRYDQTDFFGNRTTGVVFEKAHDEIAFSVRARVERTSTADRLDITPPLESLGAEIGSIHSLAHGSPFHFLGRSPLVGPDPEVTAYARKAVRGAASVLDAVNALNEAIHTDMNYDPDATTVDTPLVDAFHARRGVCQDFSHIMILGLRALGIPAGYVSGFLRTEPPKGKPRLEGADAMHAWVMAWCGVETGWVEFDPTNALRVATDHIVVARGRDYADVSPVKGVLWTAGSQTTNQAVDVIPLD